MTNENKKQQWMPTETVQIDPFVKVRMALQKLECALQADLTKTMAELAKQQEILARMQRGTK